MKSPLGCRTLFLLMPFVLATWPRRADAEGVPTVDSAPSPAMHATHMVAKGEPAVPIAKLASAPSVVAASVITKTIPAAIPPPPPPPPTSDVKWYDAVKVEGFVDVYASVNANSPKPQTGQNLGRAFDVSNGFALHWVGLNATVTPRPVGATVALRFGPGAPLFNAGSDDAAGLRYVKQAFVAWKPADGVPVQIDIGKFDTWIGADAADSHYNMNYTRSALFLAQPYFHTGVRVDVAFSERLDVKLFAVNGYNNSIDNNAMKSFGSSVILTPIEELSLYLNYLGGPEQNELGPPGPSGPPPVVRGASTRFRHVGDVIADLRVGPARVLVNADYGTEKLAAGTLSANDPERSVAWAGGNVTVGYTFTALFAMALRGGYLADRDGFLAPLWGAPAGEGASVVDGTLTLAVTPTPNLVIKLEPRVDAVSSDAAGWQGGFPKDPGATPRFSKTLFTTTLGVVATTN